MHRRYIFGENNLSNRPTVQDIVLTMFRDAHTDARMHGRTGQKQYASGHTTLGGGIKTDPRTKNAIEHSGAYTY